MSTARRFLTAWIVVALSLLGSLPAGAQDIYPNRAIKIIYPFPPGGIGDALTRIVAEKVGAKLGQTIFIDNKPGASGNIGAEMVAKATPDGYTLLASPPPPLVINQSLYPQLPFDPAKFVPLSVMATSPNVLVVHPRIQAGNVSDLVAYAKANPAKLNYASTGSGGTPHLTTEWFKSLTGTDITHIPYKGAQAYLALLAGEVDLMFINVSDVLPHLRSGKLKALAIGSAKRSAALPDVPTLAETIPGFASATFFGVVATPGTPLPIAEKLSAAIAEALRAPDVAKRLADLYMEPVGGTPAQTAAFLNMESERWGAVIRTAKIHAD